MGSGLGGGLGEGGIGLPGGAGEGAGGIGLGSVAENATAGERAGWSARIMKLTHSTSIHHRTSQPSAINIGLVRSARIVLL